MGCNKGAHLKKSVAVGYNLLQKGGMEWWWFLKSACIEVYFLAAETDFVRTNFILARAY